MIEGSPYRAKLRDAVQARTDVLTRELDEAKTKAHEDAVAATRQMIAAAVVGLLVSIGFAAAIVVFGVTHPLGGLVDILQRMARGETDAAIPQANRGDESA